MSDRPHSVSPSARSGVPINPVCRFPSFLFSFRMSRSFIRSGSVERPNFNASR